MSSSPGIAPGANGGIWSRLFGKTQIVMLSVLIALLLACAVVLWTTSGAMAYLNQRRNGTGAGAAQSMVNLQPWQTAQALAQLAVSAEEMSFAREAERLADHEVDQAFATALRQARLQVQHRTLTGDALALSQKVAQLQQIKKQDQAVVDSLSAKTGESNNPAANSPQPATGTDDLDVAKAQLGLDSDELADAQQDLARSSAQRFWPVCGCTSSADMRTRSSERSTQPSTSASTPSSCAICAGLSSLSLYCITEVREMTRRFLDLRKLGDQRVGHSVGEIILFGIASEILQGQHRQRLNGRRANGQHCAPPLHLNHSPDKRGYQ